MRSRRNRTHRNSNQQAASWRDCYPSDVPSGIPSEQVISHNKALPGVSNILQVCMQEQHSRALVHVTYLSTSVSVTVRSRPGQIYSCICTCGMFVHISSHRCIVYDSANLLNMHTQSIMCMHSRHAMHIMQSRLML